MNIKTVKQLTADVESLRQGFGLVFQAAAFACGMVAEHVEIVRKKKPAPAKSKKVKAARSKGAAAAARKVS